MLLMILVISLLSLFIIILLRLSTRVYVSTGATIENIKKYSSIPLASASVVLGLGLGGFIDTTILRQITQWYGSLINKGEIFVSVSNLSMVMLWDCIFRFFMLSACILGIYLLWKLLQKEVINRSGYLLSGGLLTGWGTFNLAEDVVDRRILRFRQLMELSSKLRIWSHFFLISGCILIILGLMLIRKGEKNARIA